jgi:hypothetical protein
MTRITARDMARKFRIRDEARREAEAEQLREQYKEYLRAVEEYEERHR